MHKRIYYIRIDLVVAFVLENTASEDTIFYFKIVRVPGIFPCAPQLWNALPRELRMCDSAGSFKKALKTFLFKKAFFMNLYKRLVSRF